PQSEIRNPQSKRRHHLVDKYLQPLDVEGRTQRDDDPLGTTTDVLADAVDDLLRRANKHPGLQKGERRTELGLQGGAFLLGLGRPSPNCKPKFDGAHYRPWIPPLLVAPLAQDLILRSEDVRSDEGNVPTVGVFRHHA